MRTPYLGIEVRTSVKVASRCCQAIVKASRCAIVVASAADTRAEPARAATSWACRSAICASLGSTGAGGGYTIETVRPGSFTGPGGEAYAPQLSVTIFARGLLKAVRTRVFLAPVQAIKDDPLARAIDDPVRLGTLVATPDPHDPKTYRWDVRLQGEGEAAFIEF